MVKTKFVFSNNSDAFRAPSSCTLTIFFAVSVPGFTPVDMFATLVVDPVKGLVAWRLRTAVAF